MGQQRQMPPQMPIPMESEEDKTKREAAVVQEMQNQRATLKKQREDYQRRASALTRELKILREQRNKLAAVNQPHSPTTRNFLKENDRLQSQIQHKLSTIENVIDMLSGIIGTEKTPSPPSLSGGPKSAGPKGRDSDSDESESEKLKSKLIQSMKKNKKEKIPETNVSRDKLVDPERKVNYVFYDPEMHWCPMCNVFPKSAKDYLNHLHSKEHLSMMKNQDSPWHEKQQNDAYADQNPHFDVDWMADRQKAYDIYREKTANNFRSDSLITGPGVHCDMINSSRFFASGKLKKRSEGDGGSASDDRRRSRDRTPDRRSRRRSRSRGRYSRSRSRSRSPYYNRYGRRRSSSRGRRSSSRGRRVIEKPVVNYPPEPKRLNEKKTKGKDGNGERKKSPPKKKVPPPAKGKLPFIGRMPVFKKQVAAEDAAKQKEAEGNGGEAQSQTTPAASKTPTHSNPGMSQGGSMDDELMPDPTQYMVLLSGGGPAPPPPPMQQDLEKNEEVLPPGIDEAEADLVPKPISDAPRPRKGPLPKDFQDALDLIFPDEKKKESVAEPTSDSNREPVDMEGVTAGDSIPEPGGVVGIEEVAQGPPMGMYNTYGPTFPGGTGYAVYEGIPGAIQADSPGIVPPPPPIDMDTGNSADNSIPHVEMAIEESKESSMNKIELDDLALLGIDADDMAAQCM
uniref:Uncharacterized protein n=1 Tax=Phlebotomus papatasi TaxID=29031 RepID=A0A1B0GNK4_PHLPP